MQATSRFGFDKSDKKVIIKNRKILRAFHIVIACFALSLPKSFNKGSVNFQFEMKQKQSYPNLRTQILEMAVIQQSVQSCAYHSLYSARLAVSS